MCPRCGARLVAGEARVVAGPPGYAPALIWPPHERPDGRGKCRLASGLRLGADRAMLTGTDLSVTQEAPGLAE